MNLNSNLAFNRSNGLTVTGAISGLGSLTLLGTGDVRLFGANTYTGGTTISAGTLIVGNGGSLGSITGNVLNNSAIVFNRADATLYDGNMSGTGTLTKQSIGTLVLTGANTHTGGTTITNGTIQVGMGGTTGSLTGNVALQNLNSVLAFNRSDTVTFGGIVSGAGALVQGGTGTLALTGANTYAGGTFVQAGRLRGDSVSLHGDIQDNATVEFAQSGSGTFAGRLFGAGLLEKTGNGLLTLTGDNSNLTGDTRLLGGELRVNSLLSRSRMTIASGATLSGTGTIGGLIAQSGSIVAPGNGGIGTLSVNGNIQLVAGSTLNIQVQPAGSDLLLGNGTAQLAGTLALSNGGGSYTLNATYVLLQAASRTGTFDNVTGLGGFGAMFLPRIVYTGTQVQLLFAPASLVTMLGATPGTANQIRTLTRIDAAVAAGFDPAPLVALYMLTPAALPAGADALSGEIYPTATRIALDDERLVREAAIGRVRATQDAGLEDGFGAWGEVVGSWGSGDSDGNAAAYDRDQTGFVVGLDDGGRLPGGSWRFGLFGHHVSTTVAVDARGSNADIDRTGGGAYAGLALGGFRARAGVAYSRLSLDGSRSIAFTGFAQSAAGETDGKALQGFGEIAYRFQAGARAHVEPFFQFSLARVEFDPFSETGGAARLRVARQSDDLTTATLGLRGEVAIPMGAQTNLRLGGSVGARRLSGDRTIAALIALDAAPGQSSAILAAPLDRTSLVGGLDATLDLGRSFSLTVGYSGVHSSNAGDDGARATIALRF